MKKLIIDCDTGVDDAQAIILAALSKEVEILAITCVAGNVPVDLVAKNTLRVLQAINAAHIPVFIGCEKPLISFNMLETVHTDATKYHGNDGLGDVPEAGDVESKSRPLVHEEKAAVAICRLVQENPGDITIVALGPLTNIALAFRLDHRIPALIKEMFIMGGAVYCKGNVTVVGEFNTATDPEAASIVLESAVTPTYLMPWETSNKVGLDWDWHSKWVNSDKKVMKFLKEITAHTIKMDRTVWKSLFCPPDLVTMAWVLRDTLALETAVCHCYVDCGGNPLTRGQLIVDWQGLLKRNENVTICLDWCLDTFRKVLENMVQ